MECRDFLAAYVPQFRLKGVQYRVSHLVANDIGTLSRIDGACWRGAVEEVKGLAIVVRVEIDPFVEDDLQGRADLPLRQRNARRPEIRTPSQRFRRSPIPEIGRSGRVYAWLRSG